MEVNDLNNFNTENPYNEEYILNDLAYYEKISVDDSLALPSRTFTGSLLPKEGLTLTYYPSFGIDQKSTFKVRNSDNIAFLEATEQEFAYVYRQYDSSLTLEPLEADYHLLSITLPIKQGETLQPADLYYHEGQQEGILVESVSATVTVQAGTFENVIVLLNPSGGRDFLVEGIGIIKSTDSEGNVVTELISMN